LALPFRRTMWNSPRPSRRGFLFVAGSQAAAVSLAAGASPTPRARRRNANCACQPQKRAAIFAPNRSLGEAKRMARLAGVVIVTGAASGLGRESAIHFAGCGAAVLAVDINRQGLDAIASPEVEPFVADLTRSAECAAVAERAAAKGPISGLFNCAGIERHGSVVDMSEDAWDQVMNVNLKAIFLLSKHVIPHMVKNGGGSVVNMSSIQALATQAGVAAYAATKGAVLSLTRVMALDHGKDNIRVTAICPGTIDTPLARANAKHWNPADPGAVLAEWGSKHALNRIGRPIEVAQLAAFLISEESSFITGSYHLIDGGLTASF
jgi:NAD(P)-dependent dehydrogenase (short-subunit alcohol dehydrogenase family)